MPVIRSAKKKLKVDKKRESANKKARALISLVIKKAQKKPTQESVQKAFQAIDKGIKKDIFHKNKGARIKSRLAKLIAKKSGSSAQHKTSKPSAIKKVKKKKK
jgi:small subunit ribosomal protein S20